MLKQNKKKFINSILLLSSKMDIFDKKTKSIIGILGLTTALYLGASIKSGKKITNKALTPIAQEFIKTVYEGAEKGDIYLTKEDEGYLTLHITGKTRRTIDSLIEVRDSIVKELEKKGISFSDYPRWIVYVGDRYGDWFARDDTIYSLDDIKEVVKKDGYYVLNKKINGLNVRVYMHSDPFDNKVYRNIWKK